MHSPPGVLRQHVQDAAALGCTHQAPYFHDNSAKTLENIIKQYVFVFTANIGIPIIDSKILLTEQDIKDIIAFLRLL